MKKTSESVDHFKLLCDFGELNWIFTDSRDIDTFLHRIVTMVARHMNASACTIFLYDDAREELVLKATEGLGGDCVGKIRLKIGEGLTGLSLQRLKPVCVTDPTRHPSFKYIKEIDEEQYGSFLSVPITRGISKIGVLALHKRRGESFSDRDVRAMEVVASQLANIIESAGTLLHMPALAEPFARLKSVSFEGQELVQGMSASEGSAMGPVFVLDRARSFSEAAAIDFLGSYSKKDFRKALEETEQQLKTIQERIEEQLEDAASLIFTSHLLILKDQIFINEIDSRIEAGESSPTALLAVAKRYIDIFTHSTNPYVREKVKDVEDVILRILGNLDRNVSDFSSVKDRVVIARELYPSDILTLASEGALGIIQVSGGITSHVAILAQSLQVPMIIVDLPQLVGIPKGTRIIMDADLGNIYINPPPDAVESYKKKLIAQRHLRAAAPVVQPETYTRDGTRVHLLANINLLGDLTHAMEAGAEGVGLYRTEFPFLIRADFPTEAEQYVIYKRIIDKAQGKEVTFRTLDIGGDKVLAYFESYHEANPFLGLRSIRFSLRYREVFRQQLRAMLQACAQTTTRIMFPMISSLDEFLEAKALLLECRDELMREGVRFKGKPKVGMMVEVPALTEIMEDLVEEADFFSLGTNDLIQYLLGVDRTNEKVADLYLPHHPSVLRTLKRIVDVARAHRKEISICGAMGHQRRYIPFLLGIGIRNLSVNSMYLPRIQKQISELDLGEAERHAEEILKQGSISAIQELLG